MPPKTLTVGKQGLRDSNPNRSQMTPINPELLLILAKLSRAKMLVARAVDTKNLHQAHTASPATQ